VSAPAGDGCGAPVQGQSLAGIDVDKETVIQGVVTAGGAPVPQAYVRLLDASGEFTAEVQASPAGEFRFFARPGQWVVRALSRSGNGEATVTAGIGVNETPLAVAS
jgi:hypothetical protein